MEQAATDPPGNETIEEQRLRATPRHLGQPIVRFGRPQLPGHAVGALRSPYFLLVLLFLMVFAYTPPRWQDWNQNSRFNLTRAIVEQQTVRIDDYVSNTGDYAEIDGRYYSDKAPGLSLMAVPVYAITEQLQPLGLSAVSARLGESESFSTTLNPDGEGINNDRVDTYVALYIATVSVVALPAALMLLLLARIVLRLTGCRLASVGSVLIVGLATSVFTYSQAFYGHIPAAACLVGALALIVLRDGPLTQRRLLAIGALLGWAVVIEFPAAVAGIPIALWVVWLAGRRGALYGIIGAAPPLLVLVIYDLIAFGTVMPTGYQHSALWQDQHSTGFLSLTYPHGDAIYGLLASPFRGLLYFSPVLIVALAGMVIAFRHRSQRQVMLVVLASFALFFLMIASSIMWWGGFAVGPRYLVPVIPLLALPLGVAVARLNASRLAVRAAGLGVVGLLSVISGLLIWGSTFAGQNYPPDSTRRPLADYVWPRLQEGDVARNLGMAVGLDGVVSLIPLVITVLAILAAIGLALVARRDEPGDILMPGMALQPGDELVT